MVCPVTSQCLLGAKCYSDAAEYELFKNSPCRPRACDYHCHCYSLLYFIPCLLSARAHRELVIIIMYGFYWCVVCDRHFQSLMRNESYTNLGRIEGKHAEWVKWARQRGRQKDLVGQEEQLSGLQVCRRSRRQRLRCPRELCRMSEQLSFDVANSVLWGWLGRRWIPR